MISHLAVKHGENVSDTSTWEKETTLLARVYYEQLKTHYPTLIVQLCYGCFVQDRRLEAHNMCRNSLKTQIRQISDLLVKTVDQKIVEQDLFKLVQCEDLISFIRSGCLLNPWQRTKICCTREFWDRVFKLSFLDASLWKSLKPSVKFLHEDLKQLCHHFKAEDPAGDLCATFYRQYLPGVECVPRCVKIFANRIESTDFYYIEPNLYHDVLEIADCANSYRPLLLNAGNQILYILGPCSTWAVEKSDHFLFVHSAKKKNAKMCAIVDLLANLQMRQSNRLEAAKLLAFYNKMRFDLSLRSEMVKKICEILKLNHNPSYFAYRLQNLLIWCRVVLKHYSSDKSSPKMVLAAQKTRNFLRGSCISQKQNKSCDYLQYFLWKLCKQALVSKVYNFELTGLRVDLQDKFSIFKKSFAHLIDLEEVSLEFRIRKYGVIVN